MWLTIKLCHFLAKSETFAYDGLKLWLVNKRREPAIDILERFAELWIEHLKANTEVYNKVFQNGISSDISYVTRKPKSGDAFVMEFLWTS